MLPDRTAGKIILDLLKLEVLKDEDQEIMYEFLVLAYGAGFDEGRSQNRHRKQVIQCDINTGEPLEIHESITIAARKVQTSYSNITGALRGDHHTAAGYIWKLVNKKNNGKKPHSSISKSSGS